MMQARFSEFVKLVRVQNLLIIAGTLCLVRWFVINPELEHFRNWIPQSLNNWQFALLVVATMCIAAAGYIINDYFDVDIDRVNKPDKMVIGNSFSRQQAFRLHLLLNVAGVVLGIVMAWFAGNVRLGFIFIVVAGLLWFYAKVFKRVFLLGNLVVGLMTGLVVLLPAYFETHLFDAGAEHLGNLVPVVMTPVLAYALFAFLSTLIREILKDIQDVEGDREYDCKTVPVVLGIRTANWIVTIFIVVLIGLLFFPQRYFFAEDMFLKVSYILVALQLPLAALIFYLIPAETKEDFGKLSDGMKIIMVLGIASMAVFHYLQ